MKIGFFDLLTILFIGLKLGNVIDWSWFYVLLPMLIPVGIFSIIFVAGFTVAAYNDYKRHYKKPKNLKKEAKK